MTPTTFTIFCIIFGLSAAGTGLLLGLCFCAGRADGLMTVRERQGAEQNLEAK